MTISVVRFGAFFFTFAVSVHVQCAFLLFAECDIYILQYTTFLLWKCLCLVNRRVCVCVPSASAGRRLSAVC